MYSLALIIFVVSEKKAFEYFPIGSNGNKHVKLHTVYVCVGGPYSRDPNWMLCLDCGMVY